VEKTHDLDSLEEFFWLVETGQSVLPVIAAELVGSTSVNNWREAVVAVTKEGLLKRYNYDVEIARHTRRTLYRCLYRSVQDQVSDGAPHIRSPGRRQRQSRTTSCVDRCFEHPVELECGKEPRRGLASADLFLMYGANSSDNKCAVVHKV
jgi:hypothetical protein